MWGVIFYMIGVRDSIDEIASSISLYIFDVAVLVYFLAFPTIVYIYHPFVRKRSVFFLQVLRVPKFIWNNYSLRGRCSYKFMDCLLVHYDKQIWGSGFYNNMFFRTLPFKKNQNIHLSLAKLFQLPSGSQIIPPIRTD